MVPMVPWLQQFIHAHQKVQHTLYIQLIKIGFTVQEHTWYKFSWCFS